MKDIKFSAYVPQLRPGIEVEVKRFLGCEFEDDKVGKIYHRDGDYIYVRLAKSGVEVECYPGELKALSE